MIDLSIFMWYYINVNMDIHIKVGKRQMPKRLEIAKYVSDNQPVKNETGIYMSNKNASKVYSGEGVKSLIAEIEANTEISDEEKAKVIQEIKANQTVEQVKIRVPIAWKEKMNDRALELGFINKKNKKEKLPTLNGYVCSLIAKDLGEKYSND